MLSKDVLLSAHYHIYIYRFLWSSFVPVSLRMVHVLLGSGLSQTISWIVIRLFLAAKIYFVSIGPFLFRIIYCSTCYLGILLVLFPIISLYLFGSIFCCILIAFIAICKSSGDISDYLQAFHRYCGIYPVHSLENCCLDH